MRKIWKARFARTAAGAGTRGRHVLRPRFAVALLLAACLGLATTTALAAPIQRDITVDGDTADWKTAPDITSNTDQSSTDATSFPPDLDEPQATGRDLATFAYTWNSADLFLWVERSGSASNKTYWWFYIDTDDDALMEAGDVLLLVTWQGNTGALTRTIYDYTPDQSGGDPLVCPATGNNSVADGWCPVAGVADGYDMPGSVSSDHGLSDQGGGLPNGLEMEVSLPWSELGGTGPISVQFHVSSSNGSNVPTQLDDNMDGPAGGSITFVDLEVTKSADETTAPGNTTFTYTIDIVNSNVDNDATNVEVTDPLPANLTYQSSAASQGSYDDATGIWSVGTLAANGGSASLDVTVVVDDISTSSTATNTAATSDHDQPDEDTSNNSDSVDVDLIPGPKLAVTKTAAVIDDPHTTTVNYKAIPGATVRYSITIENSSGAATADAVVVTDDIPANTAYVPGSIQVDGSPEGDGTGDGDDSDFGQSTAGAVTGGAGDLGPGSTVTVTFDVTVD